MKLRGQWFQLPIEWQAEAKSEAALERVNLSEWIADAVYQKLLICRANKAKGVENEQKSNEI